jgi:hypothetical protein
MPLEVFAEALRERRRSLLWWTLGLAALVALNVAFYPSVRDDPALGDYARDLPESLRALFAGGELDIASPAGYLNSRVFALLAPLLLIVFAIGAGSAAVAGEEERGALELVLAHPIRRRDYVLQRFLGLAVVVAALTIVLLATVALGSRLVDLEISFGKLVAASVGVGLLLSSSLRSRSPRERSAPADRVRSRSQAHSRSPPGSSTASHARSMRSKDGGRSRPTTTRSDRTRSVREHPGSDGRSSSPPLHSPLHSRRLDSSVGTRASRRRE